MNRPGGKNNHAMKQLSCQVAAHMESQLFNVSKEDYDDTFPELCYVSFLVFGTSHWCYQFAI